MLFLLKKQMREKKIGKTFAKYVSLNVLGTFGFSCYILADTFFIARGLGTNGLTALNISLPVFNVITGIGLMIGVGGATRFSLSKSDRIFTESMSYLLIVSLAFVVVGLFFSRDLASALGADNTVLDSASVYLKTMMLFTPMFLLNNVIQAFVRNDGRPGLAMTAMLLGSLLNIILDYIFIFSCNLGMLGAALATGSAPVLGLLIMSLHFLKRENTFHLQFIKPSLSVMCDISALGVSSMITEFSSGIVILVFNYVIIGLVGNIGVAAYGIIANIALVIMSVFLGISQGIQPLFSDLRRLRDYMGIRIVLRISLLTSIVLSFMTCLALVILAEPIVAVFNKDNDLLLSAYAERGMFIYFWAFVFVGINIVISTYFSSIDMPKPAFVISLLRGFVMLIPMVIGLSHVLGMDGVWMAMTCSEFLVFVMAMITLHRKKIA
jgi:Na+-driven multidrug efflux pump